MAKKVKICLDAGHYAKNNRSPVVPEYYESEMNWKLHKKLKTYLEGYGFEVIVTREKKGVDKALYDRGATSRGCDLFISIHSNAASSETVDRVDIYGPLSGKGHDIAKKLAECIKEVMQTKQGAFVKTRKGSSGQDYYGVIRGATAVGTPGLLVEHSFHTNVRAAKWLLVDENLDKLAKAEAKVLAEHYGLAGGEPEKEYKLGDRTLTKGMVGQDVVELKEALIRLGYGEAYDEFDAATEEAVNQFKEDNGLEPNGKAGGGVFRKLAEKMAEEE